jgi:hypothetical protein
MISLWVFYVVSSDKCIKVLMQSQQCILPDPNTAVEPLVYQTLAKEPSMITPHQGLYLANIWSIIAAAFQCDPTLKDSSAPLMYMFAPGFVVQLSSTLYALLL